MMAVKNDMNESDQQAAGRTWNHHNPDGSPTSHDLGLTRTHTASTSEIYYYLLLSTTIYLPKWSRLPGAVLIARAKQARRQHHYHHQVKHAESTFHGTCPPTEYSDDSDDSDVDVLLYKPSSSSTSSSSAFKAWISRFGRFLKKNRVEVFPLDKRGQDRLDFQHRISLMVHGRLHHAPLHLKPPLRALDIGTGTGTWAFQFSNQYPDCYVLGTDLHPFPSWDLLNIKLPDGHGYPFPNCHFGVANAEDEWHIEDKFDYIHARYLTFSVDFGRIFELVYENLRPGGWAEFHEWVVYVESSNGFSEGRGSALRKWNLEVMKGVARLGKDVCAALAFKPMLERLGFVNIVQIKNSVPLNPWVPERGKICKLKALGEMGQQNMLQALQPFTAAALTNGLGYKAKDVEELLVDVRKDILNTSVHAFTSIMTVYCQKPQDKLSAGRRVPMAEARTEDNSIDPAAHIPIWS